MHAMRNCLHRKTVCRARTLRTCKERKKKVMRFAPMKEILDLAEERKIAYGAFVTVSYETALAAIEAGSEICCSTGCGAGCVCRCDDGCVADEFGGKRAG